LVSKFATTSSSSAANASLVGAKTVIPCVLLRGETRSALLTKSTSVEKVSLMLLATSTTVFESPDAVSSEILAVAVGSNTPSIICTIPLFARISVATIVLPFTIFASPITLNEMSSP